MMGGRLDELALRRKMLLLRSERLRSDLATDQRYVLQSLSGLERYVSIARGVGKPLLMGGLGAMLLGFLRRRRPRGRGGGSEYGSESRWALIPRALVWVSTARRLLPLVGLCREFLRSRSRRRAGTEPGSAWPRDPEF
ncbi:MAG: hypothetical protein ABI885_16965 [Gammaproteobacteria bacterium]